MATTSIQRIRLDRRAKFIRLSLCRAERYNAIDSATLRGLVRHLERYRHLEMPLILTGDADQFSVGADINELASLNGKQAAQFSELGHHVLEALENWPGVTIAHLNGYALGAGLELALGCDILVGTKDVRMGLPGLAWALVPCMGGLRRLACRASEQFSSELFLQGTVLSAQQALNHHLLDRLVDHEQQVAALARDMANYSPSAVNAIRSIRLQKQGHINSEVGARMFSLPFASGECQRRLNTLLSGQ
jgi:enoyl-CoA hydratase/carnithine racemase